VRQTADSQGYSKFTKTKAADSGELPTPFNVYTTKNDILNNAIIDFHKKCKTIPRHRFREILSGAHRCESAASADQGLACEIEFDINVPIFRSFDL
jgi:hypothetical protein